MFTLLRVHALISRRDLYHFQFQFQMKMYKIAQNLLVLFLLDCIGTGSADGDDYMKREYSLVKPYHGKHMLTCIRNTYLT